MTDLYSLLSKTQAFNTINGDKNAGRLSHAYLVLTSDEQNLTAYLKMLASVIACKENGACGKCRTCKLIHQSAFSDVYFYPRGSEFITSEQVNDLIEESYLKPIESDKKIFVLDKAQTMNASAQNKLLKTLEEPPKNVHILIGATSEFPLLSTVKSRVKKLIIAPFNKEQLFDALKDDCSDEQRLKIAIACSDGTVGNATALYNDQNLKEITDLAVEILTEMQSSKDVLKYSLKISNGKWDIGEFISVLELLIRDLMAYSQGEEELVFNTVILQTLKSAKNFNTGSLIYALEKVNEAQKRKKFNANPTMLLEWLLFQILEGKYKWQKL